MTSIGTVLNAKHFPSESSYHHTVSSWACLTSLILGVLVWDNEHTVIICPTKPIELGRSNDMDWSKQMLGFPFTRGKAHTFINNSLQSDCHVYCSRKPHITHWEWILQWGRSYWITCSFLKMKEMRPGNLGLGWGDRWENAITAHVFQDVLLEPFLFVLQLRFTQGGFSLIKCPKWVLPFCSVVRSGYLEVQDFDVSPSFWQVCPAGRQLVGMPGLPGLSFLPDSHMRSQSSVLSAESVQMFMFVLNDEEQKAYKNFKVIM